MTAGSSPPRSSTPPSDGEGRLVLIADRTAESESISAALAHVGFSIVTTDAIALPERIARMEPFALVIDTDDANMEAAVKRLREQRANDPSIAAVVVVALGSRARAADLNLPSGDRVRSFTRPIDVTKLRRYLLDIAGGVAPVPPSSVGSGPHSPDSDAMLLSDFPAIAGLPEVEGILPDFDGEALGVHNATQLSPEIEALLEASAKRAREVEPDLGPVVHETNIQVPRDMLALIDDLLAPEEPAALSQLGADLDAMAFSGGADDEERTSAPGAHSSLDGPETPSEMSYTSSSGGWEHEPPSAPASEHPLTAAQTSVGETTRIPASQLGSGPRDAATNSPVDSALPATSLAPSTALDAHLPWSQSGVPSPRHPGGPPSPRPPSYAPARPGSARPGSARPGSARPHARSLTPYPPPAAPTRAGGSQPPERTQAGDFGAMLRRPGSEPPESIIPSDMAPMTHAQRMAFSSRFPEQPPHEQRSEERHAPLVADVPPFEVQGVPDSVDVEHGDPIEMIARAVRGRATGALLLSSADNKRIRRILFRDGDMVNVASEGPDDALVDFLVERGDLGGDIVGLRSLKLPLTGRHAAAALIANGYLGQDDLWPVLRAHAEWILSRAMREQPTLCRLEREPPERLRAEPNVFGGAAGAEIFIESVRRVMPPEVAIARLGGADSTLGDGPSAALLAESALSAEEVDLVRNAAGNTVGQLLAPRGRDFAAVLYALVTLGILTAHARSRRPSPRPTDEVDPLDADAIRQRVRARLALVHEADYFALLGVQPNATNYDIRRAYLDLRRIFEPNRLLTAATADLHDDVVLIVDVVEEAYQVLRDQNRRARYRRAIEATQMS